MKYKFEEQKDGITLIKEDDNIIARYKLSYKWKEVNYSFKEDGLHIRLFDKYKKYKDVVIKLGINDLQEIS